MLQKKEKKNPTANPVATISNTSSSTNNSVSVQDSYHPFISSGFLSIQENDTPIPIKIIHDTGASQSLLVEGVLPLSDKSATGNHILIKGVKLEFMSVPLYKVFLKSDLISGYVNVGILPDLPVKGVSLVLGNDLAGDKVMINPCVSSHPCSLDNTDAKVQDTPGLYPVCAVTRAMAKKQLTTTPNAQNEESKSDMKSQPSSSSAAEYPPDLTNIF